MNYKSLGRDYELSLELLAVFDANRQAHRRTLEAGVKTASREAQDFAHYLEVAQSLDPPQFTLNNTVYRLTRLDESIKSLNPVDPDVASAQIIFAELRDVIHQIIWRPVPTLNYKSEPVQPGRRARCALDLAVRVLPPKERQRYRLEFLAELADLPRRDQAPHAFRLLIHGRSLRRSLNEQPSRAPTVGLAVMVVVPGADALAAVCGLDWQATVLGVGWTIGVTWIVSSKERTRNLVTLIREARTSKPPTQK